MMPHWETEELHRRARAERELTEVGPLAADGRLQRLAPFAATVLIVLASYFADDEPSPGIKALLAGAAIVLFGAAAFIRWRRVPRRAQGLLILVPIPLLGLAASVDGGMDSPITLVILAPLVWLVLYESRAWVAAGLALATSVVVAQLANQPSVEALLHGLILIALAAGLLPTVRKLVSLNRSGLLALDHLSDHDTLTGLMNRRGLSKRATSDTLSTITTIFVDIDHFKHVNDTFGHDLGDDLLVEVGKRILATIRTQDLAARIGGDEFIVLTRGSYAAAVVLAQRVRQAIADAPFDLDGIAVSITASIGVSAPHASSPVALEASLGEADRAMYREKALR